MKQRIRESVVLIDELFGGPYEKRNINKIESKVKDNDNSSFQLLKLLILIRLCYNLKPKMEIRFTRLV